MHNMRFLNDDKSIAVRSRYSLESPIQFDLWDGRLRIVISCDAGFADDYEVHPDQAARLGKALVKKYGTDPDSELEWLRGVKVVNENRIVALLDDKLALMSLCLENGIPLPANMTEGGE